LLLLLLLHLLLLLLHLLHLLLLHLLLLLRPPLLHLLLQPWRLLVPCELGLDAVRAVPPRRLTYLLLGSELECMHFLHAKQPARVDVNVAVAAGRCSNTLVIERRVDEPQQTIRDNAAKWQLVYSLLLEETMIHPFVASAKTELSRGGTAEGVAQQMLGLTARPQ
jgi:hypothetical protein